MAIQFPIGPFIGETFPYDDMVYVWDGEKWTAQNDKAYWDKDGDELKPEDTGDDVNLGTGNLSANNGSFDGDVSADNGVFTGDIQASSLNGNQLAGFRNQLINGNFYYWNRGASFNVTSVVSFTSDRWACNVGSGLTATADISVNGPVAAGFQYAIKNTGANPMAMQQGVELYRKASNMQFYVGSQWTLSCWSDEDQTVNAANVKFKNGLKDASNTSIPVSSSLPNFESTGETANGYTKYSATFTITADASTVADADCLAVIFSVGAGQLITGCQLEPGPVATPFEHRPMATELALCQRYYETGRSAMLAQRIDTGSGYYSNYWQHPFKVTKRITPTMEGNMTSGDTFGFSATTESINASGYVYGDQSSPTQISFDWTADAEL